MDTSAPGRVTSTSEGIEDNHIDRNPCGKVQTVDLTIVYHGHCAVDGVSEQAVQRVEKAVKGLSGQRQRRHQARPERVTARG